MTSKELANLLYDVATFTNTNGHLPESGWVEDRTDSDTARLYKRLLNPETVASEIATALLDAGSDLDFERYDCDPDDPQSVWEMLIPQLSELVNRHDLRGDERDRMRDLVHDEFFANF